SHVPSLAQNISSLPLSYIVPWPLSNRQLMLAAGDSAGTLHILEIPWSLSHASSNELLIMESFFEREVKRLDFVSERNRMREIEKKALDENKASAHDDEEEEKKNELQKDDEEKYELVSDRNLGIVYVSNLSDVIDVLKRCGFPETKWYELGLRLGLKKSTLDVIEKNHPHDVSRCMTECLSQWLSRADNVDSRGGANLDSLSDALRSMNETAVAEKLKHQALINIFNNRHTVLSQSLCDSVAITQLLYAERMLTQEAVSRVVSASPSIPNQREALLTAVKEAVQTDPNSLLKFANVLCTISTNVSLGQTILDDISKYFPIPEGGVVPETIKDHDVVSQGNSNTQLVHGVYGYVYK
uniref:Death domain-containing protein n=1 Tax=Amphimedon queenslandica TaxID=400682 RepID=A0A1X7U2U0_AMPQE